MSKIDKLAIRGVRSFDIGKLETIQFHTPLTLIVGYNGSGKTTIIECLKYATTGELPPNSKTGGAFIHDPKLCGEKEVHAQVKLLFDDPRGSRMVVTRNLLLSVKKTIRQQKALDVSLNTKTNGEKTVISTRVGELDKLMPQYLGVSKAVLDSVIFCHQDESLWPMSEPVPLKKRFDEIFEAMKYTKAIQNIKDLRKHHNDELKSLKQREQSSKLNKDKGDQVSKQITALANEIEELRAELENLTKLTEDANTKAQDAFNRSANYQHVINSLVSNRDKESWLQKQLESLCRNLKERTEPDDVLQTELDQYQQRMKVHQDHRQTASKEKESLNFTIDSIRQKSRSKDVAAGKYEQQKATHEREIENRSTLVKESARRHGVRGFESSLSNVQISEYMEKLSRLQEDRASAADRSRLESDREIQEVQIVLSKLGEQKSVFQENKTSAKRQCESNDHLIASSQSELNKIEIDEGGAAIIESNIEDIEAKLRKAKDQYKTFSWDQNINESKGARRSLDDDIEQTNRELDQGLKHSKDLARVDLLEKDRDDRQRASESLIRAHNERFQNIIGMNWQLSTLEQDFQHVLEKRTNKVRDLNQQRDSTSRDLEQIEFRLESLRTEQRKAEIAMESSRKTVIDATGEPGPGTYPRDLENCQNDRDTLKADADDYAITRKLYSKSIKTAEGKNKCELCQREFHSAERSQFVQKMERKIAENTYQEIQSQLKEVEDDLKKMRAAGPSHSTWLRLSNSELPRICSEIKVLEGSRTDLLQLMESHDQLISDAEENRRDNESLSKMVASITKYETEVRNINDQREKLIAEQHCAGLSRTIDEIKEQLDLLHVQRNAKQERIEKLEADRAQADKYIANKELELRDARNEQSRAKNQLEKKAGISRRIEDLRRANHEHRESLKRLDNQIQGLIPQVSEQEAKREDISQRGLKKERELRKEASDLLESVRKLRLADQNIQAYLDAGGPSRLARCEQEMKELQEEIERVEAQKRQLSIEIDNLDMQLRDQEQTRKNIMENLTYRQTQRDLEDIRKEICNLSAQNAEADLKYHQKQATHWQNKYDLYNGQRSGMIGTMTAKDDELQRLLQDWQTSYKDAAQDYKKAHIQVETTKAAVEDLGRYAHALDSAIIKYHSLKMEEINRIAEELWKRTYQGTDVDTILIRSDNENARSNRSYNYRVCMVKQDTEMDMRGRCSAGQKVLACIIIRLALAECFGTNCGLIALDEPTTNLDRDNIRSLAESLHEIIRARQQQSNFQLIIITHDEDFLKYMKCADFCDTYFRVSRNDRQKSLIERQSIAEVL